MVFFAASIFGSSCTISVSTFLPYSFAELLKVMGVPYWNFLALPLVTAVFNRFPKTKSLQRIGTLFDLLRLRYLAQLSQPPSGKFLSDIHLVCAPVWGYMALVFRLSFNLCFHQTCWHVWCWVYCQVVGSAGWCSCLLLQFIFPW